MLSSIDQCSTKESGLSDTLYIFIPHVRRSGVRASITVVHIQAFFKMCGISFDPASFLEQLICLLQLSSNQIFED